LNEINPFEYQYKPNDVVEIPANVVLNLLVYFQKVLADQPNLGVPYVYAKDVKTKKDKDGNITAVKTEWENIPTLEAFLQTIENPIPIATELGILTEQFNYSFMKIHQDNIEKGIAKKVGTITKEKDEPSILDKPSKEKN
jgi:hypothetical protein